MKGKQKRIVDKSVLQQCVDEAEASGPLNGRTELWSRMAQTETALQFQPKPITPSVAMLRAKEFEEKGSPLRILTPVGKRGDGNFGGKRGQRTGGTRKKSCLSEAGKEYLTRTLGETYESTIAKAVAGNVRSMVKLKCLDCSCGLRSEIAACPIVSCPLHSIRPYKEKEKAQ